MRKPDYKQEIADIIRSNVSPEIMRSRLDVYHENDISEALRELSIQERKLLYRIVSTDKLSKILEYVDEEEASTFLAEMELRKAIDVLTGQDADAAVAILRSMPKDKKDLLIAMMDEESRQDIRLIASFEDDQIGSHMSTNYISFGQRLTVKEAMKELIAQAAENDNISTLFVVDELGILRGAIDLKELIVARQDRPVMMLAATSFPYVYGSEDITDCLEKLKDYSENSIPVLDGENRLIGVITAQNIIEVADNEMADDYAKFAGLTEEEDLTEPLKDSMKKRLPWLLILFAIGITISSVISVFENVMSHLTLLMVFQSLILDMSGNAGTQSLAVTLRVINDDELKGIDKAKFVLKEIKVGFSDGLIMGLLSVLVIGLYIFLVQKETVYFAFMVSGCIGIALVAGMVISSLIGAVMPMVFHKLKVDPAVVSGPLITTLNDFVAVMAYYGLSWFLLIRMLHF